MPETPSFARKGKQGKPKGLIISRPPQTVAEFIQRSFDEPIAPTPKPEKVKCPNRGNGIWGTFKTAEERSAYAKSLAAKRKPENMRRAGRQLHTPNGWSHEAAAIARAVASTEAAELVTRLKFQGVIAKDDRKGEYETLLALAKVRGPGSPAARRKLAARLLRHYHPEMKAMA